MQALEELRRVVTAGHRGVEWSNQPVQGLRSPAGFLDLAWLVSKYPVDEVVHEIAVAPGEALHERMRVRVSLQGESGQLEYHRPALDTQK